MINIEDHGKGNAFNVDSNIASLQCECIKNVQIIVFPPINQSLKMLGRESIQIKARSLKCVIDDYQK